MAILEVRIDIFEVSHFLDGKMRVVDHGKGLECVSVRGMRMKI